MSMPAASMSDEPGEAAVTIVPANQASCADRTEDRSDDSVWAVTCFV
jgi:hypothetical protein